MEIKALVLTIVWSLLIDIACLGLLLLTADVILLVMMSLSVERSKLLMIGGISVGILRSQELINLRLCSAVILLNSFHFVYKSKHHNFFLSLLLNRRSELSSKIDALSRQDNFK